MGYVTKTGTESYTYYQTKSRVNYDGFEDISIARPLFIYFKVDGLRPNTRHFFFFDNKNVTNYVNTDSVNINDYYNLPRNDPKRTPGEKYTSETGFPTALGGPTSEIYSSDTGTIEGVFYLQSNNTLNFPAGTRTFSCVDVSVLDLENAISLSQQQFVIDGGIEKYSVEYYKVKKTGTRSYSYKVWVDDPPAPKPPTYSGGGHTPAPSGGGSKCSGFLGGITCAVKNVVKAATSVVSGVVKAVGNVVKGVAKAVGGIVKAISKCCFIMLEARYGDGTMDDVVRRYRDEKMTDRNRRGYYKVAEVFVPLMRKSDTFKWIITKTFADPLVSYGKYYYGQNKHGWIFKPVEKFWMSVFNTVGGETQFIRENGEVV